jgi:hypothetical protein
MRFIKAGPNHNPVATGYFDEKLFALFWIVLQRTHLLFYCNDSIFGMLCQAYKNLLLQAFY